MAARRRTGRGGAGYHGAHEGLLNGDHGQGGLLGGGAHQSRPPIRPVHAEDAPIAFFLGQEPVQFQHVLHQIIYVFLPQGQGRQSGQLPVLPILAAPALNGVEEGQHPLHLLLRRRRGEGQHMGRGLQRVPLGEAKIEAGVAILHVLYELVVAECRARGFTVETGVFAAEMQVASVNDGPVTILLDTKEL